LGFVVGVAGEGEKKVAVGSPSPGGGKNEVGVLYPGDQGRICQFRIIVTRNEPSNNKATNDNQGGVFFIITQLLPYSIAGERATADTGRSSSRGEESEQFPPVGEDTLYLPCHFLSALLQFP
jgi:hypothetical protein